jgi:hypothetical protein
MADVARLLRRLKYRPTDAAVKDAIACLDECDFEPSTVQLLLTLLEKTREPAAQECGVRILFSRSRDDRTDLLLAKLVDNCPSQRLVDEFVTRLNDEPRITLINAVHPLLLYDDRVAEHIARWIEQNGRHPFAYYLLIEALVSTPARFAEVAQNWLSRDAIKADEIATVRKFLP